MTTHMDMAIDISNAIQSETSDRDVRFLLLEWTTQHLVTQLWQTMIAEADACYQKLVEGNHHVPAPYFYNDLDCKVSFVRFKRGGFRGFIHEDQNRRVLIVLEDTGDGTRIRGYDYNTRKSLWNITNKINSAEAYFDCRDEGFLGGSPSPQDLMCNVLSRRVNFSVSNITLAKYAMFDIETLHTSIVQGQG